MNTGISKKVTSQICKYIACALDKTERKILETNGERKANIEL